MFEAFKTLIGELAGGDKHPDSFDDNDYRVACAALLLHAAAIDGNIDKAERDLLHLLLKQRFKLDDAATRKLIEAATTAEHEAVDLYHFTRLLNRSLDDQGRQRLIEMMWQIAFVDGRITEFEENLIWRAADLLSVSSRDRITLRQRVTGQSKSDA
jgi:uncharacterized tellurite resistance protein B-like protein